MNELTHTDIIKRLCASGFPAFTVGGAVRDMMLGEDCSDFDIVTAAHPDQIEQIFVDRNVKTVGKSFGVVLVDGIEVATFRKDSHKILLDARKCEVSFANSIEDDLSRRDFTINALALCEITGDVVDCHNGQTDLIGRLIRFVGSPTERILEDPARIIRACRFLAKLEGRFAHSTLKSLQEHSHLIKTHVAPERIRLEILKAMKLKTPSLFWSALELIGGLKHIFPEMHNCVGHDHGNHHLENVWEHMMLAGDRVSSKFPLIRLAAFLHDIGKPATFDRETKMFINHENLGEIIVRRSLTELKFSKDEVELVACLVRHHMHSTWNITPRGVRRIKKRLADCEIALNDWFRMKQADRSSNIKKNPFTIFELLALKKKFANEGNRDEAFNVNDLAIRGGDIVEKFNLPPSPIIGIIQRQLLDFVIENGFEFNTVEALTEQVNEILQETTL